jgi:hypothetical protein
MRSRTEPGGETRRGLELGEKRCYVRRMQRRVKTPNMDQLKEAVAVIGIDRLDRSGFEDEQTGEGFSGAVALPSTYLHASPKASH